MRDFLTPVAAWFSRLGQELAPLLISNGGPIIGVQVENEYGSFGSDKVYLGKIRDLIVQSGFSGVPLYTSNGPDDLAQRHFTGRTFKP